MEDIHPQYPDSTLKVIFDDFKKQLDRIELQTCKTNGRVSKLESWKSYVTGAVAIITIFGGAFIGLVVYVYNMKLGTIDSNVESVKTELISHIDDTK